MNTSSNLFKLQQHFIGKSWNIYGNRALPYDLAQPMQSMPMGKKTFFIRITGAQNVTYWENIRYLYRVNQLFSQLIAYFFLLCMTASVVPLNLFHHHVEESHCDLTNAALESDPCHLSIYHANAVGKHKCNHDAHLLPDYAQCELCKVIRPNVKKLIDAPEQISVALIHAPVIISSDLSFLQDAAPGISFSRGPPA